jgi:glutathione synthase/RimK-type ligase-like ATP-grasp enzyme
MATTNEVGRGTTADRNDARTTVALVTCQALANLHEDDHLLVAALAKMGIASVPAVWSDPGIEWATFGAVVMRTPWDYFERVAQFRAWLDARIAERAPLCNAPEILTWNFDKSYLQELARAGVATVPTIAIAKNDSVDIAVLARTRGWNEIVVKPTIGGGAYRTHRFRIDELDRYAADILETLADRGVLVQPFLPEIQDGGELSLLFFDGIFSHAVCKRPKSGDYRVQFEFGGSDESVTVSDELIVQARVCIGHAPTLPVYARVDGVVKDGKFLLMELEVFEPLMFLSRHPEAPARFARAIADRLLGGHGWGRDDIVAP